MANKRCFMFSGIKVECWGRGTQGLRDLEWDTGSNSHPQGRQCHVRTKAWAWSLGFKSSFVNELCEFGQVINVSEPQFLSSIKWG